MNSLAWRAGIDPGNQASSKEGHAIFEYRFTALLLPTFLLLALPALAAYPWQIPLGKSTALPLLTLLTILFGAVRYPGLLLSPFVFTSGLLCDLFTSAPLGFWTLLFLLTLACARTTTLITHQRGKLAIYLCLFVTLIVMTVSVWALASLYKFAWQDLQTSLDGMIMALLLLPIPALVLLGLEKLLIFKNQEITSRSFGSQKR